MPLAPTIFETGLHDSQRSGFSICHLLLGGYATPSKLSAKSSFSPRFEMMKASDHLSLNVRVSIPLLGSDVKAVKVLLPSFALMAGKDTKAISLVFNEPDHR